MCILPHTGAHTHSSLEVPTPNLTLAAVGRRGDWGAVQVKGLFHVLVCASVWFVTFEMNTYS